MEMFRIPAQEEREKKIEMILIVPKGPTRRRETPMYQIQDRTLSTSHCHFDKGNHL